MVEGAQICFSHWPRPKCFPRSKRTLGLSIQKCGLPMRTFESKEQEVGDYLGKAVYSMASESEQFAANWQDPRTVVSSSFFEAA